MAHFIATPKYLAIMPPYLPAPLMLVYISGVAEICGGLGVLLPPTRRLAAWGIVALLIAVFPANIYMLQAHVFPEISDWVLWLRLLLQFPLMAWAWFYARR